MSDTAELTPKPSDLAWADDIQIVYRYLGQIVKGDNLEGSKSAKALHDWVSADAKNETAFLTTMSQKSIDIIQKYRKTEIDDTIGVQERRTILDLKLRLAEAVEEAAEVRP